jgi:glycosyltransferase involved in cell wall biosynthesis
VFRGFDWATGIFRPRQPGQTNVGPKTPPAAPPSLARKAYTLVDELTTIPDKEMGWVVPALASGLWGLLRERPHVLYSSSPPWSGQVVALGLARASGLPWVADFRDPWARAPWRETQPARIRRAAVRLERRVVQRADAVLFATDANRSEYGTYYGPEIGQRFHLVRNGCDPHEFRNVPRNPPADRFVLLHAGSLYGARSPRPLFQAIDAEIGRGGLNRDRFRLRLVGDAGDGGGFRAAATDLGLDDVVEFRPRVPRREIIQEMTSAACLLVLQPGTTVSIPGKLYEYLAVGRPILALADAGETVDLVRESGVGVAVDPHDVDAIAAALRRLVHDSGGPLPVVPPELYDGNRTADEAVAIIERVAHARRSPRTSTKVTGTPAPLSASKRGDE